MQTDSDTDTFRVIISPPTNLLLMEVKYKEPLIHMYEFTQGARRNTHSYKHFMVLCSM